MRATRVQSISSGVTVTAVVAGMPAPTWIVVPSATVSGIGVASPVGPNCWPSYRTPPAVAGPGSNCHVSSGCAAVSAHQWFAQ